MHIITKTDDNRPKVLNNDTNEILTNHSRKRTERKELRSRIMQHNNRSHVHWQCDRSITGKLRYQFSGVAYTWSSICLQSPR